MIQWKFYIDDTEYPQPESFTDLVLGLKRDPDYHGVIFEASVGSITFYGAARDYILEQEKALGLKANIVFRADVRCDENGEFEEIIKGKLNMGKMEEACGNECYLSVPIEQENCTMLLRNRFDQKVDMDALVAFDKITALQEYTFAGFDVTMPSKALQVSAEGTVGPEGDPLLFSDIYTDFGFATSSYIRPSYENQISSSITTTQLMPTTFAASDKGVEEGVVSPVVLIDEAIDCFSGDFTYSFRFKGNMDFYTIPNVRIKIIKGTLPDMPKPLSDEGIALMTVLVDEEIAPEAAEIHEDFDHTYTGTTQLDSGEGIWAYVQVTQALRLNSQPNQITFDPETSVNIQAIRQCPESDATVYLINEALSRAVEAVTNGCLKVKSDYYGRIDSQPYTSLEDGCGSLRLINSGLQLRNAVDAKLFLSLKDCFEGLNPIDNIGFGIEPDPARPGFDVMRVEDIRYFYRNEEVLALRAAPNVKILTQENEHYSKVLSGYQKWEVESVNGLGEYNSNREYRTSLTSVSYVLSILSKFVAGSYPIEITRQQSYALSGAADTKYDNETFIYCVERQAYDFVIEQGNVINAVDIFSPTTIYNWRIRPYSNLQRWFKTIAASYPNIVDTDNKLFFSSGTGNYKAAGEMEDIFCKPENGVKAENSDMGQNDFDFLVEDPRPIWRAKTITFRYPLSVGDYKKIKASPYGYISVQCGTGEWLKGYVLSVQYSPTRGEGDFVLRLKQN